MPDALAGSCLCGAVRFRANGPFRPVIACHCHQCRKTSGHYVAATQCDSDALAFERDEGLRWYRSSPEAERGFCAACGSSLFWRPVDGRRLSIMAGCLDGESGLRLESQLFIEQAGDYYEVPPVPAVPQATLKR